MSPNVTIFEDLCMLCVYNTTTPHSPPPKECVLYIAPYWKCEILQFPVYFRVTFGDIFSHLHSFSH